MVESFEAAYPGSPPAGPAAPSWARRPNQAAGLPAAGLAAFDSPPDFFSCAFFSPDELFAAAILSVLPDSLVSEELVALSVRLERVSVA